MRQIDKVAREIKKVIFGSLKNYYYYVIINLNTEQNALHVQYFPEWAFYFAPKHLIPLVEYYAKDGNWGSSKNWELTKKRIATDIKEEIKQYNDEHEYYGKVVIPSWLKEEIDHYTEE